MENIKLKVTRLLKEKKSKNQGLGGLCSIVTDPLHSVINKFIISNEILDYEVIVLNEASVLIKYEVSYTEEEVERLKQKIKKENGS